MILQKNLLWLLCLWCTVSLPAQSQSGLDADAITKFLYQHANDDSPGVAVGIVMDGRVAYEHYLGYANIEHAVKAGPATRFNIASNAKQFTALCILQLQMAGKLKLEDDFRTYLPDFYPDYPGKISISQLLCHTSGIRDVYYLWGLQGKTWWELFVDNQDALELLKRQRGFNFEPGTDYLYSNSNYLILTEIVKVLTETDFDDFAKSTFQALDMPNSSFLSNFMEVLPHKASPYGNWNGWKEYPFVTDVHGDGALFTTLGDQLQWEMMLQKNAGTILSSEMIERSQQPIAGSGTERYGYGLMFGEYKGKAYAYHHGSTGAYHATFLRFPTEGTAIVVMSNSGGVPTHYLAKQIADEVLDLEASEATFPAGPASVQGGIDPVASVGTYREVGGNGTIIRIKAERDTLVREIYQRDPVKLIKEEEGLYHYANNQALKMAFTKDEAGQVGFTLFIASQAPAVYRRLPAFHLERYNPQGILGSFFNAETETTVSIAHAGGDEYLITKNGRERKAKLVYRDFLRMNSYEINVVRDASGTVTGLNVDNDRVRNIVFEKLDKS
ncbi:MAG: serine hydrolase domain-containing protein [Bacteroidota bacterium]